MKDTLQALIDAGIVQVIPVGYEEKKREREGDNG